MNDEARDAYLQSALKHAPDALAGPPPALSEAILREAQAKARDLRPAPPARSRKSWWDWLSRPSAASGFAGVMLAVLVGLMWREQASDLGPLREPAQAASTTAGTSPTAPQAEQMAEQMADAAAPAAIDVRPQLEGKVERQQAEAPKQTPKPAPAPVLAARKAAPPQAVALAEATPSPAPPAAPAAAQAPAAPPPPATAIASAKIGAMADAVSNAAAPVPAPVAEAAKPVATPPVEVAQAETRAQARSERSPQAGLAAIAGASTHTLARMAPALPAPAVAALTALRQALATEPARWTWQRGGDTPPQPVTPALRDWLATLDQAAAGTTWQPALPAGSAPAQALRLLRDGQVAELLWWEGDSLRWQHDTQPPQQLSLPSGQGQALQQALEAATR
ncbi:hypothetical protein LRH25_31620 [Ideonella azotifigens]|uniref:DUF3619 family protein n=1 Tax=Ideonella azotifigens TaxID=513160 RepID=A0ABN1K087_9BURK|nr:hypothetical protein [Ideonella azotifigens]MCD2344875.1 hypothetical protein [Ideonella azotifigens]